MFTGPSVVAQASPLNQFPTRPATCSTRAHALGAARRWCSPEASFAPPSLDISNFTHWLALARCYHQSPPWPSQCSASALYWERGCPILLTRLGARRGAQHRNPHLDATARRPLHPSVQLPSRRTHTAAAAAAALVVLGPIALYKSWVGRCPVSRENGRRSCCSVPILGPRAIDWTTQRSTSLLATRPGCFATSSLRPPSIDRHAEVYHHHAPSCRLGHVCREPARKRE